jgi:phage shock protein PspC (stress-responsive transcriptional regulator)
MTGYGRREEGKETPVAKQIIRQPSVGTWLQVATGVFFVTLGIAELSAQDAWFGGIFAGVSQPFGPEGDVVNVVASLVELVGGVGLLAMLFVPFSPGVYRGLIIATLVVWGLRVLYHRVFTDVAEPDPVLWLNAIALDLIVGFVLWMLAVRGR